MKTSTKILSIALVCAIPLGAFAYDKFDHDADHDKNSPKHSYFDKEDKDDHEFEEFQASYEFLKNSGVNLAFEGELESKPTNGYNGTWKISGTKVIVTDATKIFMDDKIRLNDEVSVLAKREAGEIKAVVIEID